MRISAIHPQVIQWAERVRKNGGTTPGYYTVNALSNFYSSLQQNNLINSIKGLNCFVPDSLIAATTPLIVGNGSDPWTNNNLVDADLTKDGLKFGKPKYLNTNINASSSVFTVNNCGISVYISSGSSEAGAIGGYGSGAGTSTMAFFETFPNFTLWDCYNNSTGRAQGAIVGAYNGFMSANRVASNNSFVVRRNSTTGSLVTLVNLATVGGAPPNQPLLVGGTNGTLSTISSSLINPCTKRYSFVAFHDGLSKPNLEKLYTITQQMRVEIGGGYA